MLPPSGSPHKPPATPFHNPAPTIRQTHTALKHPSAQPIVSAEHRLAARDFHIPVTSANAHSGARLVVAS